ncbi:MAG: DinB family protein [Acidobacteriota bacterium]
MRIIKKPKEGEYPPYTITYINQVPNDGNLIDYLGKGKILINKFYSDQSEKMLMFRYEPEKWTMKDILAHIIDDERIFAYRALRFARGDKKELPGVDQDLYADNAFANARSTEDLLDEYNKVRDSSIALFKGFNEKMITRCGIADGHNVSVSALGYLIAGHEMHHLKIIKERYLN